MSASAIDGAKRAAAIKAINAHVHSNQAIGIGSGSTVVYAVERLAERVKSENLTNIRCVPTSFQSRELILKHNLFLSDLDREPTLDVCFDGADEVDAEKNLIKGGGGCLLQEKIVASCAKEFYVLADYRKKSNVLGTQWTNGVPVEVIPMARTPVMAAMRRMSFVRNVVTREGSGKAGPLLTDNGNFILDVDVAFDGQDVARVEQQLSSVVGVVETGLFVGMAKAIYYGMEDGSVEEQK